MIRNEFNGNPSYTHITCEQFVIFYKPLHGLYSVNCPNPCYTQITWVAIEFIQSFNQSCYLFYNICTLYLYNKKVHALVNLIALLIIHTYTYLHLLQYHFLNKRPICFKAHLIMTEDDNGTLFIISSLNCSLDIITIQKKVYVGNTKNEYIELQIIQIPLSPSKQKP